MDIVKKYFLVPVAVFIVGITIFILMIISGKKQDLEDEKKALSMIGGVQFRGHVIHHKVYDYGGKNYYMVCVKLDYSNVKTFYVFNNICFLKIKNGIATMANGFLSSYDGVATYVDVNINNDRQERFFYSKGQIDTLPLRLNNFNLTKQDLNECN